MTAPPPREPELGDVYRGPPIIEFNDDKWRPRLVVAKLLPKLSVAAYGSSQSTEIGWGANGIVVSPGDQYGVSVDEPTLFTAERVGAMDLYGREFWGNSPALLADWRKKALIGWGIGSGTTERLVGESRRGRFMRITNEGMAKRLRSNLVIAISSQQYGNSRRIQTVVPLYEGALPGYFGKPIEIDTSRDFFGWLRERKGEQAKLFAFVSLLTHIKDEAIGGADVSAVALQGWASPEDMAAIDAALIDFFSLK